MVKESIFTKEKHHHENTVVADRKQSIEIGLKVLKEYYPELSEEQLLKKVKTQDRTTNKKELPAKKLAKELSLEFKKRGYSLTKKSLDYFEYSRWTKKYGYVRALFSWTFGVMEIHINNNSLWWNMEPKTTARLRTYLKAYFAILNNLKKEGTVLYGTINPCKITKYVKKTGEVTVKYLK